jgi:hypothetical protein
VALPRSDAAHRSRFSRYSPLEAAFSIFPEDWSAEEIVANEQNRSAQRRYAEREFNERVWSKWRAYSWFAYRDPSLICAIETYGDLVALRRYAGTQTCHDRRPHVTLLKLLQDEKLKDAEGKQVPGVRRLTEREAHKIGDPRFWRDDILQRDDASTQASGNAAARTVTTEPTTPPMGMAAAADGKPKAARGGRKPNSGAIDDDSALLGMLDLLASQNATSAWDSAKRFADGNDSVQRRLHRKFRAKWKTEPPLGKTWADVKRNVERELNTN